MGFPPEDELEVVLLYQPIVREEARRLAKGLRQGLTPDDGLRM